MAIKVYLLAEMTKCKSAKFQFLFYYPGKFVYNRLKNDQFLNVLFLPIGRNDKSIILFFEQNCYNIIEQNNTLGVIKCSPITNSRSAIIVVVLLSTVAAFNVASLVNRILRR